ncbi:MAG TPA: hypothetical protein VH416_03015 [Gaiellaceae bacterium]|jgi:hypothetical protein
MGILRASLLPALLLVASLAPAAAWPAPASKPPPKSVIFQHPGYQLTGVVAQSLLANGVRIGGKVHKVVKVTCVGLGKRGPKRRDSFGGLEFTYHEFNCGVTTRTVRLAHARVLWWADNTYRYDFFGCKKGRGCL